MLLLWILEVLDLQVWFPKLEWAHRCGDLAKPWRWWALPVSHTQSWVSSVSFDSSRSSVIQVRAVKTDVSGWRRLQERWEIFKTSKNPLFHLTFTTEFCLKVWSLKVGDGDDDNALTTNKTWTRSTGKAPYMCVRVSFVFPCNFCCLFKGKSDMNACSFLIEGNNPARHQRLEETLKNGPRPASEGHE